MPPSRAATIGLLAGVTGTLLLLNRYRAWRVDMAWRVTRRFRPDGVQEGAEPFTLRGDPGRAVLLLHGAGDTAQSMRALGEALHAAGYTVRGALLPGHGRSPAALRRHGAADYLRAARAELDALAGDFPWVAVVAQSMGGALAVRMLADDPRAAALVLLAPYLSVRPFVRRLAASSWIWGVTMPFLPSGGERSILDDEERRRALSYGMVTPRGLRALVRTADSGAAALPRLRVPTLMLQSRHDNRIPADAAAASFARLGAPDRQFVALDEGGHVISVDRGRERVFALTLGWLARHGGIPRT